MSPPQRPSEPNAPIAGVLLIDKPYGMTSMAVCAKIRAKLRAGGAPKRIKVGHGGTLDPLATGLLVVLVGRATRLCNEVMADSKEYVATVDLGYESETHDLESEPRRVEVSVPPDREAVERVLRAFVGTIEQTPPAHSAMKVGGRRAYELARRGEEPPLQPRPVHIDRISILRYEWPLLELDITCGKGTYIRSLARDVGRSLRAGGLLRSLRRTRSGRFGIEEAVGLDELPDRIDPRELRVPGPGAS